MISINYMNATPDSQNPNRQMAALRALTCGTILLVLTVLAGCGGGNSATGSATTSGTGGGTTATYSIGGTVTGLSANGLTLTDGTETVSPAANATTFTFPTAVASGTAYTVTVTSQPTGLTCTVSNGTGTVASTDVTSVKVACATNNLSGTAATGSPITDATVTLVDSQGAQVTAKTDSKGNYSLSTAGMTPPFLVKVVTASPSPNGYATGTVFYSVSDQATPSVINVTPLTDLIIRDWYAAQSAPVTVDTAFANPKSNPPPTATEVQLVQAVVLEIVQPVLQQQGVNPLGLDLISGTFSANGAGVDAALDQIKPITYNSTYTTASLTIDTTTTTTQTTTVTASPGSTQISTTTSNSASSTTTSSVVSTAIIPASSAEAAALAGAQATLTSVASTINTKGSALTATDLQPYLDSAYLNDGTNATQQAQEIAQQLAGATIDSFQVTQVESYDGTNNLIGITGTMVYTAGGVTGSQRIGYGNNAGLLFKQETNGSWLMYGDQQEVKTWAQIWTYTQDGVSGNPQTTQELYLAAQAPAAAAVTPCVSNYASTVTAYSANPVTVTVQNGTTATIDSNGYPLPQETTLFQGASGADTCQFDDGVALLAPAGLPGLVGNSFGFAINGGAQIPALAQTIQGFTTEAINFTNLTSHALSAAQLGQSLTVQWSLPVTFPITDIKVFGNVWVASGSNYVNCTVKPGTPIAVTSTSTTLTLPTSCNGIPVVSLTSNSGPGSAASVTVQVDGANGQKSMATWSFD